MTGTAAAAAFRDEDGAIRAEFLDSVQAAIERSDAAALRVRTVWRHEQAGGQQPGSPTQPAHHFVAMFFQNRSRLSSPPNNVVKIVESASRMSPARSPFGGIHRNMLNSR